MALQLLVGAALGAAAASSSVRKMVRRGITYGLAGALMAYDRMSVVMTDAAGEVTDRGPQPAEADRVEAPAASNGIEPCPISESSPPAAAPTR
jgi:hypothetical protein